MYDTTESVLNCPGCIRTQLKLIVLLLACLFGSASATSLMPKFCMRDGKSITCPPIDQRSPVAGTQAKRRLMDNLEQRLWSGTVIDMRNDWYRVVFDPEWDEYLVTEVKYCRVEVREYTDGLGHLPESTKFYYLRIDKEKCQKDRLVELAQSYVPFDSYRAERTICDSQVIQDCMSAAVWLIGELAERFQADPNNPRDVRFVGPSGAGPLPESLRERLGALIGYRPLPEIFVEENRLLVAGFCARYGTEALICSTGNDQVTINIFALKEW